MKTHAYKGEEEDGRRENREREREKKKGFSSLRVTETVERAGLTLRVTCTGLKSRTIF